MEFDQDLCLNLQYDFGKMNSTLGSVVPLAMLFFRTALFAVSITVSSLNELKFSFIYLLVEMQANHDMGGGGVMMVLYGLASMISILEYTL